MLKGGIVECVFVVDWVRTHNAVDESRQGYRCILRNLICKNLEQHLRIVSLGEVRVHAGKLNCSPAVQNKGTRDRQRPAVFTIDEWQIHEGLAIEILLLWWRFVSNAESFRDAIAFIAKQQKVQTMLFLHEVDLAKRLGRYRKQRNACLFKFRLSIAQGFELSDTIRTPPAAEEQQESGRVHQQFVRRNQPSVCAGQRKFRRTLTNFQSLRCGSRTVQPRDRSIRNGLALRPHVLRSVSFDFEK